MAYEQQLDWLNIVAMQPEYQNEIVSDIRSMYDQHCISETAFILTLVPEGEPPVNKAQILGERFVSFRQALGATEMPVGILIQATVGHGWTPNSYSNFQQIVFPDGASSYQFCPLGLGFQKYVGDAIGQLAALKPDFMMVDDDFRLLTGRGGCFCPLHMARFNQQENADYTRESLMKKCEEDKEVARRYDALQCDSLLELARVIRQAMDKTDPNMPCSFCACSGDTRHAVKIAEVLAAPGQPKTVRINNARYLNESLRSIPEWLLFSERQIAAFPADYKLLAEPDTYPHNRYSTSAAMFNAQLTHSILSGCCGGKLWLSRTGSYEPASGERYRRTLSEKAGFYQKLAELPIVWNGVATLFNAEPVLNFPQWYQEDGNVTWATHVLGKMGIPIYFSNEPETLVTLANRDCDAFSDTELELLLKTRNCLLDGIAAQAAAERGFSRYLGVDVMPRCGNAVTFECDEAGRMIPVAANLPTVKLMPHDGTEVLSTLYHRPSGASPEAEALSAGATLHQNPDGGSVAVIAVPVVPYGHTAFAMLNESRKAQLLEILERLGGLDWYIPGDDEVLLRAGSIDDHSILIVTNLSLDEISEIPLAGHAAPRTARVEYLAADGSWLPILWEKTENGIRVSCKLGPLQIAVLRIAF